MKGWKISEAKARLSEVVASCLEEPQVLYNRKEPVAALIDMEDYTAFLEFKKQQQSPSITEMLKELKSINASEAEMEALPSRVNRPIPEFESPPE